MPSDSGPVTGLSAEDVARLRLVCLVRAGDAYVVRGAGRFRARGDLPAQVDISFGDTGNRRAAAELHIAVRQIQRWCDSGMQVVLLATDNGVTLRGEDGTTVPLPRCAA